jgi:general secretion pathway protein G
MRRRAFTLVEVLIVMIIIAVLAAIAIPKFANGRTRAQEASLRHDLQIYREAIGRFKSDTSLYPARLEDLTSSIAPVKGVTQGGSAATLDAASFHGPYIDEIEDDPVSQSPLTYGGTSNPGEVRSSASGSGTDGTLYATW